MGSSARSARPISVGLLAVPESSAAVIYGLHEVLTSVGVGWAALTGRPAGRRRMRPQVVSADGTAFETTLGVPIAPDLALGAASECDVVIVADLALDFELDPRGRWPAECAWLRESFAGGATVCSVCTGSVLLAEAGLLDGREATTHWAARRLFQRWYPAVDLQPERILVSSGPEGRLVTGGGSASWAELALHLVARFCGRAEAVRTAKIFLLGDRADGQLPFAVMTRPRGHGDAAIETCQAWLADHYALPNPVGRMVEHSGLPTRTVKRRFRAATGYAPLEYVQRLRVEEAKQLMETTRMAVDAVGAAVGYEDPASFRRIFKRIAGVTPALYRRRFRGIGEAQRGRAPPGARSAAE